MNLINRLLGRRAAPTADWGVFVPPMPVLDLSRMRFGSLGFGDGFEAAAFLGRPDRCVWTQDGYCELLYAGGGFQLDYDGGRFSYLAFFIGPDRHQPDHPALAFSAPRLCGDPYNDVGLSQNTDRQLLERMFGPPGKVDAAADETILNYTRKGVAMEFEMDGVTGLLKRWNLYPE
jgi:hypothetical protein